MLIEYHSTRIEGTVNLPSSKSISNRLLILKHLTGHPHEIINLSEADDTLVLKAQLDKIKSAPIIQQKISPTIIDVGNAGTAFRFLAPVLCNTDGTWLLTGSERMLQRPIKPLVDALHSLGADIEYEQEVGYPPLAIHGHRLSFKPVSIDSEQSSQFASAIIMMFMLHESPITMKLEGDIVSVPYIDMTIDLAKSLGADIHRQGPDIHFNHTSISTESFVVEADWSSASYFYELCALNPDSKIFLNHLQKESLQGDSRLAEIFKSLGVKTNFQMDGVLISNQGIQTSRLEIDLNETPDLVPALVCTCAGLGIEVKVDGIGHLRIKESDRIESLKIEMRKLGCEVTTTRDTLTLKGHIEGCGTQLSPHDDHRLAMAFAPLVTKLGKLWIENPEVVSKSYPTFWQNFQSITKALLQPNH